MKEQLKIYEEKKMCIRDSINEIPEGHIGIPGGLVLVEIQPEVHKKGHVIFHVHIDGIFQGDDRQLLRIRIGGLVDRVIKT